MKFLFLGFWQNMRGKSPKESKKSWKNKKESTVSRLTLSVEHFLLDRIEIDFFRCLCFHRCRHFLHLRQFRLAPPRKSTREKRIQYQDAQNYHLIQE
ncbi:hypothetical protein F511_41543 [Dorcoceras hygrometricum]|uniref:Uncharacterized protein n=1 Tax=Dorcoceras hygrometricum TaxID=472368 RepID=A0A2Z7AN10_9LAMI|nr:hypothetical protein F511_41543 [Dorcoceras hygrometricum]